VHSSALGEESFGEAAIKYSMDELKEMMDEVFAFINDVLMGMQEYFESKEYTISNNVV
jgi:hypothetical protein